MSAARIEWNADVPDLVRKAVEPLLGRYLGLIPPWCVVRVVRGIPEEGDGTPAEIHVSQEYRAARLVIYPAFLECDPEYRETCIVHELLHIPTMAMKTAFHDLKAALNLEVEHPALSRWADEIMRQANEAATTDLTEALRRLGVVKA